MSEPKIEPWIEKLADRLMPMMPIAHYSCNQEYNQKFASKRSALIDIIVQEHAPSSPAAPLSIKRMVERFLQWKLPENFNPDGGISFKKTFNEHTAHPMKNEPAGTNLFDFNQAEAMIRYIIGYPAAPEVTPSPCCENPKMVVKGVCVGSDMLHQQNRMHDDKTPTYEKCSNWRPTHNVCLNCGKEEKL